MKHTYQTLHHSSCFTHVNCLPAICNSKYQAIYRSRSLFRYCS